MLKLIVNADDFGLNDKVNEEILNSFQNGILRSTSLIANGNSFDQAVEIIRSNPNLDVGIHLTLVDTHPLLKAEQIPTLINADGTLIRNAIQFAKKYFLKDINLIDVRKELSAQIEKILDYGIIITHIDSHQHLHLLPGILDIAVDFSAKYGIKFIRLPKENVLPYMFYEPKLFNKIAELAALNYLCYKAMKKINYRTDFFAGYYFGGNLSKVNLIKLINTLPVSGSCELMCHPGLISHAGFDRKNHYRKIEESNSLIDREVVEMAQKRNIEFVSFRDI